MHEHSRRTFTEETVVDPFPVDFDLPGQHLGSLAAHVARETRYRLGMAQKTDATGGHAIARLADSGEDAMRNLVALPLRMLAGAFGICEALLRTAADAVSDVDPINERVVELEKRLDSLDPQATSGRESSATASPARKRAPSGSGTAAGAAGPG